MYLKKIKTYLKSGSVLLLSGWLLTATGTECTISPCLSSCAYAQMSSNQSEMLKKSKELQEKAHARTIAAVKRMHKIIKEKRRGKKGFSADFNTVPGDKKR